MRPWNPFGKRHLICGSVGLGLILGISGAVLGNTDELPNGDEVARRINERDDGAHSSRKIVMELTEKSGKTRTRVTRSLRKDFGDERRIAIFFDEPRNLRGTAFLTYDYPEQDADDDQWLYLPALRKTRRVSGADRGDFFMGTDFSYDDMKQETKVSAHEYRRETLGIEDVDGMPLIKVEATPVTDDIADEVGYSKIWNWVDPEIWIARKSQFWDTRGELLKTMHFRDIVQVDGIWTPHILEVENHKTGHRTVFRVSDVDYKSKVSDSRFKRNALGRGS